MLHRIDGVLVAVGFFDLTTKYFDSAYFIYDPAYKFLNLGVMGAVREIEYCRMIKQIYNPRLEFYQLGDIVMDCPKVNYKANYLPGLVMCPYSKLNVPFEIAKETIDLYKSLTVAEKKGLPFIKLS